MMPRLDWRELVARRVPQVVGVYLAAGWGMLEFSSWAAERALVPAGLVDSLLVGWIAMLPVAIYLAWRSPGALAPDAVAAAPRDRSVAVLPFENHSAIADDAYLSDGITDEVTTALARVGGLRVASRTSTRALAQRGDVQQIGRGLNVGAVLEGEVQRSGRRLRVSTRLVNVEDGYQLWSGRYEGDMEDVFAIEDEISGSVVEALKVVLGSKDRQGLRTHRTDVRAYEFYLRGRQFFHQTRRKSFRFARAMFRSALEIDPDYAPALAALADAISLERTYYPDTQADAGEADRVSRRALELDPELAEAHSARGLFLTTQKRYDEAEAAFASAIRLDPRLYEAHYFMGRMRFQQGRFEEAARSFEAAVAVRDDYGAAYFAAQAYEAMGREEDARARYADAVGSVVRHMELNPDDPRAATMRAVALYRTGDREQGLEWGRRAVEIDPEDAGVRYNLACLYSVAGEVDLALETLESAIDVGFGNPEWLKRDPDLNAIRDHPRFEPLLQRAAGSSPGPVTPAG
ncbi:MAG: tetratricopeptide repeat protein [Gemmatimonadetes bacterium]|nr:tetratricopeptide repeat protein [Gemmatimonadota bacterium]NIQ53667.1 tetratricopeptide repeat protein [Gemmatimonadota bacterium]NIU73831.1 tetratricopeptide repeat protein [Gammaproteobacteria bacterium]NIX43932.1 tetratricopeptide repeat protein [Gemmatimonadota bacterium]